MRRRTGLPHRIVLDEAHYFLQDAVAQGLLDLDFNGYTVVTYSAALLPPELTGATEVILATRTSKPGEFEALQSHCAYCQQSASAVSALLGQLDLGQAVAFPITQETGGELRMFVVGHRLTPHVRHRQKYVDLPVAWDSAFVFGTNGMGTPARARTLRQFVAALDCADVEYADAYLRRGDFSRWIDDVFGDRVLADKLRAQERRYVMGEGDALKAITDAIRSRYDLTVESDGAA
jgi:hypothetical protein